MNPSKWKIVQQGPHEWAVYNTHERHFAQTVDDAVALKRALERTEEV